MSALYPCVQDFGGDSRQEPLDFPRPEAVSLASSIHNSLKCVFDVFREKYECRTLPSYARMIVVLYTTFLR